MIDRTGALYGTTYRGGDSSCGDGCGVVFKLTPPSRGSETWKETVLHFFSDRAGDGWWSWSSLIEDRHGALYGTTGSGGIMSCGGDTGCGIVFKLVPPSGHRTTWREDILYRFHGISAADGQGPAAGLTAGPDGTLYGTTEIGGGGMCFNGCATVFALAPPGEAR